MAQARGEPFFLYLAILLSAVVIAGFVPTGLLKPGGVSSVPILLHIHGAVFLAWFALLCMQIRLVQKGYIGRHMHLGKSSIALAVAMVVMGYVVVRLAYARPDFSIGGLSPAASVMFPFTDIINFVIVYTLALLNRRNANAHKRLMLLAGILIIDPAASRLVISLGGPAPLIVAVELALFSALLAYDWRTLRRPHWASLLGLVLFLLAMAAKLGLAGQPWWHRFVEKLFG